MRLSEELKEEIKRKGGRLAVGIPLIFIIVYLKNRYGIELTRNVSFFLILFAILQDYVRILRLLFCRIAHAALHRRIWMYDQLQQKDIFCPTQYEPRQYQCERSRWHSF